MMIMQLYAECVFVRKNFALRVMNDLTMLQYLLNFM